MSDNRRAAFFAAKALQRLMLGTCLLSSGSFFLSVMLSVLAGIMLAHMRGYHCIQYYAGTRNNCLCRFSCPLNNLCLLKNQPLSVVTPHAGGNS
jgi:ABC-type phosphate transport system permease subunit